MLHIYSAFELYWSIDNTVLQKISADLLDPAKLGSRAEYRMRDTSYICTITHAYKLRFFDFKQIKNA